MTDKPTRRRFVQDVSALLAASALPLSAEAQTVRRPARRVSANDRVRVAVVGVRSQGLGHVRSYAGMDNVDVVAICDVDTATWPNATKAVTDKGKPVPRTYQDVRKMLESDDIDAISTATPNHWHALVSIWAMQAGKDVYVEKPASHEMLEGRRMVQAARKYGRICQVGTQSRSSPGLQEAMAFLHGGGIGKVHLARGLCYKRRMSIGQTTASTPPPAGADYNIWLGPAPEKPLHRKQLHYDWHWFWDYGNGDLGNQGIHEMDKARWGLGKSGLPSHVVSVGGRFGYEDDGETPNTDIVFLDYGDSTIIFEVRGLVDNPAKPDPWRLFVDPAPKGDVAVGNVFYGSKGIMVMPSYTNAVVYDLDGNRVKEFRGGGDHHANFIKAVHSRNRRDLNCDIEEGHRSAMLVHAGNISYRLGEEAQFSKTLTGFRGGAEVEQALGRFEEHLSANGVSLAAGKYRIGRPLHMDARRETFRGDAEADALCTRPYRAPFIVPDRI